jgi:hypothetical protein
MAAAEEEEEVDFSGMSEAEMREWVEANPGRVNDMDCGGYGSTPCAEKGRAVTGRAVAG